MSQPWLSSVHFVRSGTLPRLGLPSILLALPHLHHRGRIAEDDELIDLTWERAGLRTSWAILGTAPLMKG